MDKKVVDLYDEYKHGLLDRREFLKRLSMLAGGIWPRMFSSPY